MAYYNGFPATYQPVYPQYQQPITQNQNQQNGVIWVQGEAGAKSYLVAPNNTVQLWDSENQTIYLKSADASGMPSMKVLDYTIRESSQNGSIASSVTANDKTPVYATKDDFKSISERIEELQQKVDNLSRRRRGENDE